MAALCSTFHKWKIKDWEVEPTNPPQRRDRYHSYGERKVVVRFTLYRKRIVLVQNTKEVAHDNLELLTSALETIRLSKVCGIEEMLIAAYRQIDPVVTKAKPEPPIFDPTSPYVILGVEEYYPLNIIEAIWKARLRVEHPDAGGNIDKAKTLNAAMDKIRKLKE